MEPWLRDDVSLKPPLWCDTRFPYRLPSRVTLADAGIHVHLLCKQPTNTMDFKACVAAVGVGRFGRN